MIDQGIKRRLPAFARALVEKRRQGLAPQRDLLISCDWGLGKAWSWRVVVGDDVDPEELDFSIAAGLSCLLVGRDQERLDRVAAAVSVYRPLRLVGVNYDALRSRIYIAAPVSPISASVPETEQAA
jgi:hypothetical protein